jgi:cell division septation protein DedD
MEEHSAMKSYTPSIISSIVLMVSFLPATLLARDVRTGDISAGEAVLWPSSGDSTATPTEVKPAPRQKGRKNTEVQEFSIQVGAFSAQKNADRLQQKLRAAGYRTDVYKNYLTANKLYYLVWVGSYQSEEAAKPDLTSLRDKFNITGVIRPRSILRR